MSQEFTRLFTPEEANGLLAELRPLVASMLTARDQILKIHPSLAPILEKALGNGGGQLAGEALALFQRMRAAIEAINSRGVLVKDINTGLLDFPAHREGRLIYLCWQFDEPKVDHWHTPNTGFAGRQRL